MVARQIQAPPQNINIQAKIKIQLPLAVNRRKLTAFFFVLATATAQKGQTDAAPLPSPSLAPTLRYASLAYGTAPPPDAANAGGRLPLRGARLSLAFVSAPAAARRRNSFFQVFDRGIPAAGGVGGGGRHALGPRLRPVGAADTYSGRSYRFAAPVAKKPTPP